MLSRQIDLASLEIRRTENSRDDRNAENYKEVTRRSALAKELQKGSLKKGSLKALKKLLASAKAEEALEFCFIFSSNEGSERTWSD